MCLTPFLYFCSPKHNKDSLHRLGTVFIHVFYIHLKKSATNNPDIFFYFYINLRIYSTLHKLTQAKTEQALLSL